LDGDGKASVQLKHGQSIAITGFPTTAQVKIVESGYDGYTVKYKDSIDPDATNGNDTGFKDMTGTATRTFAFTNTSKPIPIVDIDSGDIGRALMLCAVALLSAEGAAAGVAFGRYRRRKARRAELLRRAEL
jgi:hypothetical protein